MPCNSDYLSQNDREHLLQETAKRCTEQPNEQRKENEP